MKKYIETQVKDVIYNSVAGMYCFTDTFNVEYNKGVIIVHTEKDNEINSEMSTLKSKIEEAFCDYFEVVFKFDIYYTWNQ